MTDSAAWPGNAEALAYLTRLRWPDGPVCPYCGSRRDAYATRREGLYRCADAMCRSDFSISIGSVFERSKVPLGKWLRTAELLRDDPCLTVDGLGEAIDVSHKTACYILQRIGRRRQPDRTSCVELLFPEKRG